MQNALLVYICEMAIDIIKHSFIAKFNDIKPIAYSEFLEDLCKQVPLQSFFFASFILISAVKSLPFLCSWIVVPLFYLVFLHPVAVDCYKYLFALMEKDRD